MADAKIISYGKDIGAGTTVIPDNQVAVDIESTDAVDYIRIDTTNGAEEVLIGDEAATIKMGVGTDSPDAALSVRSGGTNSRIFELENNGGGTILRIEQKPTNQGEFTMYGSGGAAQHKLATVPGGDGVIFNDLGEDVDFRVESENDTHMLFVDSSADKIGIGESVPLGRLHVKTADSGQGTILSYADELVVEGSVSSGISILSGNANTGYLVFGDSGNYYQAAIQYNHNTDKMGFYVKDNTWFEIDDDGNQTHILDDTDNSVFKVIDNAGSPVTYLNIVQGGVSTFGPNNDSTATQLRGTSIQLRPSDEALFSASADGAARYLAINGSGTLHAVTHWGTKQDYTANTSEGDEILKWNRTYELAASGPSGDVTVDADFLTVSNLYTTEVQATHESSITVVNSNATHDFIFKFNVKSGNGTVAPFDSDATNLTDGTGYTCGPGKIARFKIETVRIGGTGVSNQVHMVRCIGKN